MPDALLYGGRPCDCGCKRQYKTPGTLQWYQQHFDDPLFTVRSNGAVVYSHPQTLRQQVYWLLQYIQRNTPGRAELETVLALMGSGCATGSFSVPSLYMLRQLSEATAWTDHQFHVCCGEKCPGHIFIDRDSCKEDKRTDPTQDKVCPHCKEDRYIQKNIGGACFGLGLACDFCLTWN